MGNEKVESAIRPARPHMGRGANLPTQCGGFSVKGEQMTDVLMTILLRSLQNDDVELIRWLGQRLSNLQEQYGESRGG